MLRMQNVVVYAGDQADRALIRRHEFPAARGGREYRFHVLLTSYEVLLKDRAVLREVEWEILILDEAHRMKVRRFRASGVGFRKWVLGWMAYAVGGMSV